MRVTAESLADGREIFYFDEDGAPDRHTKDLRELGERPPPPELRFDPLRREWAVVAAARLDRTFLPPANACPLDPSSPDFATEIPAPDYSVVTFENRFPSLSGSPVPGIPDLPDALDDIAAISPTRVGYGRCEVICFASDHTSTLSEQDPDRMRLIIEAWAHRVEHLCALPEVEQVFVFENRGEEIGVTLLHPHGQIYAIPFVTPRTSRELESVALHREQTGGNLYADLLAAEEKDERVVAANDSWLAFVPRWARWPVEVALYPRRQVANLAALDEEQRTDLATIYLDLLRRLDRFFAEPGEVAPAPYIAMWHQAPRSAVAGDPWLHLELFTLRRAPGKLKYLAGAESGMGLWINDRSPEQAAQRLREVGE